MKEMKRVSEYDAGWVEDEACENCSWWSVQYKECYADDPGNGHCFESNYADDDVDCGMITNFRLLGDL